jgi:hypothetical protein
VKRSEENEEWAVDMAPKGEKEVSSGGSMAEQTLTRWLKTGYPHIKAGCGLPPWVLPERSLSRVTEEVGDAGILKVGRPLGLAGGLDWLKEAPDPATVSPEAWQEAVKQRQSLSQFGRCIGAFLKIADTITAGLPLIRSRIDPMVVCRSLAVLLFAPFIDQGKAVLAEVASALSSDGGEPSQLILSYGEAVMREDIVMVEKVNQSIVKYSAWQEWALALQEEVLRCRYTPRVIAVTPPLSAKLVSVVATMIKEGHDEFRRDYPGYSGKPVLAQ